MQLKSLLNLTLKKVVYTVLGEVENRSKILERCNYQRQSERIEKF